MKNGYSFFYKYNILKLFGVYNFGIECFIIY